MSPPAILVSLQVSALSPQCRLILIIVWPSFELTIFLHPLMSYSDSDSAEILWFLTMMTCWHYSTASLPLSPLWFSLGKTLTLVEYTPLSTLNSHLHKWMSAKHIQSLLSHSKLKTFNLKWALVLLRDIVILPWSSACPASLLFFYFLTSRPPPTQSSLSDGDSRFLFHRTSRGNQKRTSTFSYYFIWFSEPVSRLFVSPGALLDKLSFSQ